MLGLLRRFFSSINCIRVKRSLYLSLVCSQLHYCSVLWRPHFKVDIRHLETVQRRATRFIVNDNSMDYKERLMNLNILPLMMQYEISDIMFLVKCIRKPSTHFNISDFITFSTSNTRSSTYLKLKHSKSKSNTLGQFYFNRIPRLWNSLPCIDLDLSIPTIRAKLRHLFWNHFISKFDSVHTTIYVHAIRVLCYLSLLILINLLCSYYTIIYVHSYWLLVLYHQTISTDSFTLFQFMFVSL